MSKPKRLASGTTVMKPKEANAFALNLLMLIVSALLFTWAIASAWGSGNWFLWIFTGVFGLLVVLGFVMMTTGDTR